MAETLEIHANKSVEEKYKLLSTQLKHLLVKEDKLLSNLSNFTAALKQTFEKISWVGFYLYDGNKLFLGPFQGKIACTQIEIGKGVCGKAAAEKQTVIVPNVEEFPGHIFCDPDSKSEIVIPIIKAGKLLGVLDLDSNDYNSFNDVDKQYLEILCDFLAEEIFNN